MAVNAEYAQDWLINQLDPEHANNSNIAIWRMDPQYSGAVNCVGDIGTHVMNYVSYVTGLKIKKLLATTNMKLSSIAMEIGYNEPNYFSHVFRKLEGITPKEYRNRVQGNQ
jgi:hypothetical protein